MPSLKDSAISAASAGARDTAEPPYEKAARDSVTVYCREVLNREPGLMAIELLPDQQARAKFSIDRLALFCTVNLGTGRCTLQIDVTCEKCNQTQRHAFASLAALGRILEVTRCAQCAAAAE